MKELSRRNKYWIDKHRYYELKHFCLQYPLWKKAYIELCTVMRKNPDVNAYIHGSEVIDSTADIASARVYFSSRMGLVQSIAMEADDEIGNYIFEAVTKGLSFDTLKTVYEIPCGKDLYYDRYRKFFWLLSNARDEIPYADTRKRC